ncbi:hypothetical protein [Neisseria meningitidis]|uniref:hypothetical protein n=1 Tax=Neisseria meningitidis TaxID=487 RepID=UPI0012FDC3D0|nr:hypothetical protein [Neisseria meningitidis]MCL6025415.1 hypothetical protein [Neisseria meningitidis]
MLIHYIFVMRIFHGMTKRAQKSPIGKSESGFFVMFCSICVLTAGRSVRARFGRSDSRIRRLFEMAGFCRIQVSDLRLAFRHSRESGNLESRTFR